MAFTCHDCPLVNLKRAREMLLKNMTDFHNRAPAPPFNFGFTPIGHSLKFSTVTRLSSYIRSIKKGKKKLRNMLDLLFQNK